MNVMAGRAIAAVGVVLAFVAIWTDRIIGTTYWSDGTTGAFLLVLAGLATLGLAAGYTGQSTNGAVFAAGAVLLGFYGWIPVALAFDDWDQTRAGAWLGLAGAALIVIGAGSSYLASGGARNTPAGLNGPSLVAGLGIALVFPGIFIDSLSGTSYWNQPEFGRSLGIVLLVLAIACALTWAAGVAGTSTRGLDQALTLVLLGLVAFVPVGAAFNDFGTLRSGAWIALAGGILAAGGTWAARGTEMPHSAAAP